MAAIALATSGPPEELVLGIEKWGGASEVGGAGGGV